MTVSAVLGQLAAGQTIEDILNDYPYLEREDVLAALSTPPPPRRNGRSP